LFFFCFSAHFVFASPLSSKDSVSKPHFPFFSVFLQPSIAFLGFDDRDKFQVANDSIYLEFMANATSLEDSSNVNKQNHQKVNFTFPISVGVQVQHIPNHFISTGIGFIYNKETVVLQDHKNNSHAYYYALQAVPLFLEYRLKIPPNLITLSQSDLFSVAFRWYWMLSGSEIYSNWGTLKAESSWKGNGFGVSFGYLIGSFSSFQFYGDLGFTSISLNSKDSFSKIVPYTSESKKAKWDLGGIQMQFRMSWGSWTTKEP
jgi:hypothetical protein